MIQNAAFHYAVFGKPLLGKKKNKNNAKDRGFIGFSSGYFKVSLKFWPWIKAVRTLQTIVTIGCNRALELVTPFPPNPLRNVGNVKDFLRRINPSRS